MWVLWGKVWVEIREKMWGEVNSAGHVCVYRVCVCVFFDVCIYVVVNGWD